MSKMALVVDDSRSARYALRKMLEAQGYLTEALESGEATRQWLDAGGRPDIIFLDHIMPGADGFDVLRELKGAARTVTIPVVICSSHEEPEFVPQARGRGAADVLPKPPTPDQLKTVLKRLEQLSAALKPAAPIAAVPPPAPAAVPGAPGGAFVAQPPVPAMPSAPVAAGTPAAKVQPIRTPEEAIEQRVMQNLRDALAEPAAPPPAPLAAEPAAQPSGERLQSVKDQFDGKIRKLSQDFYTQLGDIKAQVAGLDEAFGDADRVREMMVGIVRDELATAIASLREELLAAARADARAESERAQMDAAARISEQIARLLAKSLSGQVSEQALATTLTGRKR